MARTKWSSVERFRLKRLVEMLASKRGRGTELISLYIPPGRNIYDVIGYLRQEYGTASNIKSTLTRKHVMDALVKLMERLKVIKKTPETGLALFCGAVSKGVAGEEELELHVISPPKPVPSFLYRCDNTFYLEPLYDMLAEHEAYGIMLIDCSGATYAILTGERVEIVKQITSGVPSKHRAGGQSARRFQRWREFEVTQFFKRAAEYANQIFLKVPKLRGILLGGPGPTKEDFRKRGLLHYTLQRKILATVDTSYTDEQGIKEIVAKSQELLKNVRCAEERNLVQRFLYHLGASDGLAVYGAPAVRSCLEKGAVKLLLISEALSLVHLTLRCPNCGATEQREVSYAELATVKGSLPEVRCRMCSSTGLIVSEERDAIEELVSLGEQQGVEVEIVSTETEEGVGLLRSFGGIAAILKFPMPLD